MKRVLFLSYYYPPSGGPGVQRSLKFTKYLPEFGWMPTVVTVRPECASFPDLDPGLTRDVPDAVRVERTSAWDPYALYARMLQREKDDLVSVGFLGADEASVGRIARWIRANIFLPDARVGWVPFAAARSHALLGNAEYDAVLTTGPPHSTHLAGLILRFLHRKPWVTDLRDPWTEIDYYADLPMTAPARRVDAWLERTVLANASAVVAVSESIGRRLLSSTRTPIEVIENGFDPADFERGDVQVSDERFVVRHVGNLNAARNPVGLWRALRELEAAETMPDLTLSFVGNVDPVVLETASEFGLGDLIEVEAYVPHDDAVRLMRESTLLLLSVNRVDGAEGIVTGKLYEYVASGRPVLGIGPPRGDAGRVLGESGAGQIFDFDDVEGIRTFMRACYEGWTSGRTLRGATWDRAGWYSRRERARRLGRVLDTVAQERYTSDTTTAGVS